MDRNSEFDEGIDAGLEGWQFQVDGPGDISELITTGPDGLATLPGLPEGEYLISEISQPNWELTTPDNQTISVGPGMASVAQFGNAEVVVVPEPSGIAMAALGMLAVAVYASRRRSYTV